MLARFPRCLIVRGLVFGGAWSVLAGMLGCATQQAALSVVPHALSPQAETAVAGDAWRQAEAFASTIPEAEVMVGSGDSMLPLYCDRTVLVVRRFATSELRAGMTVVFTGDEGHLVAHTLVEKTPGGWIAQGLGNRERDRTRVRSRNYLGTVIKAFEPVARRSPLAESEQLAAAMVKEIWLARDERLTRAELGR